MTKEDIVVIFQEPGRVIEHDRCQAIRDFFERETGISCLKFNREYEVSNCNKPMFFMVHNVF